MLKLSILFIAFSLSIFSVSPPEILYKARIGKLDHAISLYERYCKERGCQDFELLQNMGLLIIEQGWKSKDPQEQLLALFGAGTAKNARLIPILENGICHPNPQIQLASLYFLADLCDDRADKILQKAMSSDYLIIRYEAAKILAVKKDVNVISHIEGLMCKLDAAAMPLFPPFFSLAGDEHATSMLKKFFSDKNSKVRLAAILSCLDHKRDDMIIPIRTLAQHGNIEEQEAALYTLGALKDSGSYKILEAACCSKRENIRLAALISLYELGSKEALFEIEALALKGNVYAITALGSMAGSEDVLVNLQESENILIRYNACLALLKRKDPRCIPVLYEILLKDARDVIVLENPSPGMVLTSWKPIFSASEKIEKLDVDPDLLLAKREEILKTCLDLPKNVFFQIANKILCTKDCDLVPALIALIETLQNEEAIQFLKSELHRAGAPMVRAFCNLGLFRLKESGPYAQFVRQWAKDLKQLEIISFRPIVPKARGTSIMPLTPKDTSRLFIETLTSLANQKDAEAIDALLCSLCQGNPKNRFALAGILIRATE